MDVKQAIDHVGYWFLLLMNVRNVLEVHAGGEHSVACEPWVESSHGVGQRPSRAKEGGGGFPFVWDCSERVLTKSTVTLNNGQSRWESIT